MKAETLEVLAENGSLQDVTDLLVATGASKFSDPSPFGGGTIFRGMGVDYIAAGVGKDTGAQKEAKMHAVTGYLTDPVAFAERQEIKPSLEQELRANLKDVTERLAKAEQAIEKLSEEKVSKPVRYELGNKPAPF
jgi:hypothetical protein